MPRKIKQKQKQRQSVNVKIHINNGGRGKKHSVEPKPIQPQLRPQILYVNNQHTPLPFVNNVVSAREPTPPIIPPIISPVSVPEMVKNKPFVPKMPSVPLRRRIPNPYDDDSNDDTVSSIGFPDLNSLSSSGYRPPPENSMSKSMNAELGYNKQLMNKQIRDLGVTRKEMKLIELELKAEQMRDKNIMKKAFGALQNHEDNPEIYHDVVVRGETYRPKRAPRSEAIANLYSS
jgi:hypothetical protein